MKIGNEAQILGMQTYHVNLLLQRSLVTTSSILAMETLEVLLAALLRVYVFHGQS
jgi:hypothetical protein